ncbi:MAG TPA: SDR family NAD(P)-dependent oxidoreductase [Pseudomonas sp.]|uniref:SDR family NAD(P)-dependent oxidoreductase n=1 Tax=Pseudomonas sp. TaxID=306 RepID=UPI002EDA1E8F
MPRLTGKVAIVIGGGRGIGGATARLFAAEGAKVAVRSLTQTNIDAVVAEIEAYGGTALGVRCDLRDAEMIKSAVEVVAKAWDGIDILVNNAFDPSAVFSSVIDLSAEQLQRNFDIGPVILFLATKDAQFITGYSLTPDGGMVIEAAR